MENLYTPDCIRTYSGQYVNVFEPDPETIVIEDIAHGLSMQCRFGGHLKDFYSVAEHCMHVCEYTPTREHKLAALLHDASEAYLLDIPSPIKKRLEDYKEIENNLMTVISKKFGFAWPLHEQVKAADQRLLELEWESLMVHLVKPYWVCYTPFQAEQLFLQEFNRQHGYSQYLIKQKHTNNGKGII